MHETCGRRRARPGAAPEPARARRRLWRADLLQASAAASVAIAIALYLANGGAAGFGSPAEAVDSLGIISGLAGTDLVLVMFILAARVPVIDQTVGQDRAMALHRSLGKPAFYLILGHVLLLLVGYAMTDGASLIDEAVTMWSLPDMPLAVIGLGLLTTVVVTSLVAVRRRLRYEVWHVTHVLAYAAAIAALPHQFSLGGLFTEGAWESWYWIALTALAFGSVIVWRIAVPIVRSMRHALTVVAVEPLADGAASIRLRGRELDRLGASGGQFFVWRFLSREQWWQAHPYSLSAAPGGDELRITVRALGHGSAGLFTVRPGTRVAIEGPYGIFSEASRSRQRIALVAAGIGVTPIRSLLEDARFHPGGATVVLRTPRRGGGVAARRDP